MTILRLALCWVAVLASLATDASSRTRSPEDDARATLRQSIDCWVESDLYFHRGDGVRAVLAKKAEASSLNGVKSYNSIVTCVGQRATKNDTYVEKLQFKPMLLRGAIFRGLYRQQFGEKRDWPISQVQTNPPWRADVGDAFMPLQMFGECVASFDPINARILLFAPTASDREEATYKALKPAFEKCVAPGSAIKFSRSILEGLLAEGLYHLAGGDIHLRNVKN